MQSLSMASYLVLLQSFRYVFTNSSHVIFGLPNSLDIINTL
jgi:hypothetical protein